jgi:hypothetical protein
MKRFVRQKNPSSIRLTDRDVQIIKLVHRFRFLRSSHIAKLVSGSEQGLTRRLCKLYHTAYYHCDGNQAMVYSLGHRGAKFLKREYGITLHMQDWPRKKSRVGRPYLQHTLLVADIMTAFITSCRKHPQLELIDQPELPTFPIHKKGYAWSVINTFDPQQPIHLGVRPDRVFAIKNKTSKRITYYFLEADRATMPIYRTDHRQQSIYKKLLAYHATHEERVHHELGINRFRVIFATYGKGRIKNIIEASEQITPRCSKLFQFIDCKTEKWDDDIFADVISTGRNIT